MIDDAGLMAEAKQAAERAYAPYSGFRVGAALLGKSGGVYTGVNVENAAYPLSVCAEKAALVKAVSDGEREFDKIAVFNDREKPVVPCGGCLQSLAEFSPGLEILGEDKTGAIVKRGLRELLTEPFHATEG